MSVTSPTSQSIQVIWQVNIRFILTKTRSCFISTSFLKRVAYYFHASPTSTTQSLLRCTDLLLTLPPTSPPPLLHASIFSYPEACKWWLCTNLVSSNRRTYVTTAIFVHSCLLLYVNNGKKCRLELVCVNPANLSFSDLKVSWRSLLKGLKIKIDNGERRLVVKAGKHRR